MKSTAYLGCPAVSERVPAHLVSSWLVYLPVIALEHRFFDFFDVLRNLLQCLCLVLLGLYLVLKPLVLRVPTTFQQQRVDRPLRLVGIAVTALVLGGDRDALSRIKRLGHLIDNSDPLFTRLPLRSILGNLYPGSCITRPDTPQKARFGRAYHTRLLPLVTLMNEYARSRMREHREEWGCPGPITPDRG